MNTTQARDIAEQFAPVFCQKVRDEWPLADRIGSLEGQGTTDNLNNVFMRPFEVMEHPNNENLVTPRIYYSVCATETHYFILYAVYHPLDWWRRETHAMTQWLEELLEHMHDMEGALMVVRRVPPTTPNEIEQRMLDAVITIAHDNFYLYTQKIATDPGTIPVPEDVADFPAEPCRIAKFNETIDGHIHGIDQTHRVKLYIESQGHGLYGDKKRWGGGERIYYYVLEKCGVDPISQTLKGGQLEKYTKLDYILMDIFQEGGLWDQRSNPRLFKQRKNGKWAFVCYQGEHEEMNRRPDRFRAGSANPPWSWNDHNDTSPMGEIATDPAHMILRYAQGWGPVSLNYTFNPYWGITG